MSRLDSAIRRLEAQRACLDMACRMIENRVGSVIELGLGNGRTYDHLRDRLPGRDIYSFDRQVNAHPDCIPPDNRLFLGDFAETLPKAAEQLGPTVVLAHCDVGSGDEAANTTLAAFLADAIGPLLAPKAILICDQNICPVGAEDLPLPAGVNPGRYYFRSMS